jgi:tellurite resistance protein
MEVKMVDEPTSPWDPLIIREKVRLSSRWGLGHDLVNLYLGIAHLADSVLDPEEQRTFLLKFGQWVPEVTVEQFQKIWSEVLTIYQSLGSHENRYAFFLQSAVNLAHKFSKSPDKLRSIIRDLVDIASADGELHENEIALIKAAAITYGFSADLRVNNKTGQIELTIRDAN